MVTNLPSRKPVCTLGKHEINISHGSTKNAMSISFQRTLRVPDNKSPNYLPPSLGIFPVFSVAEYKDRMPEQMAQKGGIFFPMYQREAMWMRFHAVEPFAVKVFVGGVNAISGIPISETVEEGLKRQERIGSVKQDYVVLPDQPWLDGIATDDGHIRQFVAMPKGSGYSVEAQVTGEEKIDGMQFEITPVKYECPERMTARFGDVTKTLNLRERRLHDWSTVLDVKKVIEDEFGLAVEKQKLTFVSSWTTRSPELCSSDDTMLFQSYRSPETILQIVDTTWIESLRSDSRRYIGQSFGGGRGGGGRGGGSAPGVAYHKSTASTPAPCGVDGMFTGGFQSDGFAAPPAPASTRGRVPNLRAAAAPAPTPAPAPAVKAMSLAAGGLIKQSINRDDYEPTIWDTKSTIFLNVQLLNSEAFTAVTGVMPAACPVDANTYASHGLPFFDIWNEEKSGVKGDFSVVKSVGQLDEDKHNLTAQNKASFWDTLKGPSGSQKSDPSESASFQRDETIRPLVVRLDVGMKSTFRPIKDLEEQLKQMRLGVN